MKTPPVQFSPVIGPEGEEGQGWEGGEDSVNLEQCKACRGSGPLSNHLIVCSQLVSANWLHTTIGRYLMNIHSLLTTSSFASLTPC